MMAVDDVFRGDDVYEFRPPNKAIRVFLRYGRFVFFRVIVCM